ncbi:hypothetical protein OESDEN_12727 [Oesophagostomum dentatum]|uniref:Metaxin glutathione S-transferase domain-containing protein n=1 Tax=Oesophagostomum dentatum TaxID=61180 RepID=A0A0B1SVE1_OESDE|nr:hypothetical protein OESDEN_12727 [Oesophagostomum dentatum]
MSAAIARPLSSPKEEAIARAVERMADIHTFLVQYEFKAVENNNDIYAMAVRDLGCPQALVPILTPIIAFFLRAKAAKRIAAGVGKMSTENYKELLGKDYDSFQALLGEQKFFFGDEITATDCTVFGQLATVLYLPSDSYAKDLLKERHPTLVDYCNRIRDIVFGKEFTSN